MLEIHQQPLAIFVDVVLIGSHLFIDDRIVDGISLKRLGIDNIPAIIGTIYACLESSNRLNALSNEK